MQQVRNPERTQRGLRVLADACRAARGSDNRHVLSQKQGEGTEHQRAFCGCAELAKNGTDGMEGIHSKHRRDDDETKQPLSSSTSTLERREEKSFDRGPIDCQFTCHSRQSSRIGPILGTVKRGLWIDLSLRTDGQTNTWHSGKDTILTVCHGQTNTCHSLNKKCLIGATEKKTSAFWS